MLLSQPLAVAEVFTEMKGYYVQLEDTVEAFGSVLMGKCDSIPEMAFYMVGGLDSVREKADKMAAEAAKLADRQKKAAAR